MKKNKHLTIDMGLARLAAIMKEAGTEDVPFLAECTSPKDLQLCDVLPGRAGLSDMFRRVSRDGMPVAQVLIYPPSEGTHARPYLTAKEASVKLEQMRAEMGGDAPLLTDGKAAYSMQLCDIRMDRHGAGSIYKRVTRGGSPVALVTFGAPALE